MAQAYFSLGELEKAMASLELIASDKSNEPQVRKLKDQILSGLSKQREKELLSRKAFASNLAL